MHVIDAVLDSFSNLFRSHRYSPLEKLCFVFLFTAGLSLGKIRKQKRFYNNMNSKKLKSIEEIAKGVALIHNLVRTEGEAIPT
jgi:hypothetical protein